MPRRLEENVLEALEAVKATPRTGWMLRGVQHAVAEPIAAHMAESAVLALLLAEKLQEGGIDVNPYKAASIAAVHDLAEGYIGDIVKRAAELMGSHLKERIELEEAHRKLGDTIVYRLVEEYVRQETVESKVAKLAEQLSTLIQSLRYLRQGYRVREILCGMLKSIEHSPYAHIIDSLFPVTMHEARSLCRGGEREQRKRQRT